MSTHENPRHRLRQVLGQPAEQPPRPLADLPSDAEGSDSRPVVASVAGDATDEAPWGLDAPEDVPEDRGPYQLLLRLGQAEREARWYARIQAASPGEPGLRGPAQDPWDGAPAGARTGARTSRRRRETETPIAALHRASSQERAQTERMVTVYTCPEGDPEELARRGREWAGATPDRLAGMRHPHLLHVHEARAEDGLSPVLVTEFPEGGCLAEVLRLRERLPLAQAAGVVAHLSRALAWLHSQDRAHGRIDPDQVFFTRDSAVLLGPPCPGPWEVRAPSAADDVRQLAVLAWRMLAGEGPGPVLTRAPLPLMCAGVTKPLVTVLEDAIDGPPETRPSVQEIMQVFRSAVEAEPIPLHGTVPAEFAGRLPAQQGPQQPRPRRRTGATGPDRGSSAARRDGATWQRSGRATGGRNRVGATGSSRGSAGRTGAPRARTILVGAGATLLLAAGAWWLVGPQPSSEPVAVHDAAGRAHPAPHGASSGGGPAATGISEGPSDRATSSTPNPAGGGADPASSGADAASAPDEQLVSLFRQRDRAITGHAVALVRAYASPGGGLLQQDTRLVSSLRGDQLRKVSTRLEDVAVVERKGQTAVLRATMHVSGYTAAAGETAQDDGTGGTAQRIRVRMSRASGAWKLETVEAEPSAS